MQRSGSTPFGRSHWAPPKERGIQVVCQAFGSIQQASCLTAHGSRRGRSISQGSAALPSHVTAAIDFCTIGYTLFLRAQDLRTEEAQIRHRWTELSGAFTTCHFEVGIKPDIIGSPTRPGLQLANRRRAVGSGRPQALLMHALTAAGFIRSTLRPRELCLSTTTPHLAQALDPIRYEILLCLYVDAISPSLWSERNAPPVAPAPHTAVCAAANGDQALKLCIA